ncbi:hypothetical protein BRETT_001077 [Brettanomyces bruxellensis]|uniref:Uncharacterized protein n=1 Tax=Dekkera bruxellensis TaxID=5007 RepID=A0A871RB11_DEKBR|nr:uncharacterized protein BRETT_001077 [Brettanomyces bruxellensis]QOU21355.1 hypothetical protein BRETT_001077 [Brettanomyces bruxellensis]
MVQRNSDTLGTIENSGNSRNHGYISLPTSDILNTERIGRTLRGIGEHVVEEIYLDDDNSEEIEHFNYKHELRNNFSVASIVGLGFSLMNVPFGISTTLSVGLICGGSVTIFWGWVLFSFFTILISLSLSEIASKFPTSGGVYHYGYLLASKDYALPASWFTGWFLIIGNWLMFVSCAFGGSQFILSIFGLKQSDYKHDDLIVFLLYIVIVVLAGLVNLQFQKHLEKLNTLCIYWTIYTILIMDILLIIFSTEHHDIKYIFTHFDGKRSGWPNWLAFIIGAIQFSSMTFNGYGSIVSMSEEVKNPERSIPKGMIFAVLMSSVIGISFILPILTILPDLTKLLDDNPDIFPIDIVFKLSTRSFLVSMVLVLLIVGSLFFATIGTLTTASRAVYAFGRDHGLPFDNLWQKVDTTEGEQIVPTNALLLSVFVACIFGLFSLVSSSAFSAFIGCSVIALNVANGIPILGSILNKRKKIRGAAFKFIDVESMNYAFVVFFLFAFFITALWYSWGKYHFQGPLIDHSFFLENCGANIPLSSVSVKSDPNVSESAIFSNDEMSSNMSSKLDDSEKKLDNKIRDPAPNILSALEGSADLHEIDLGDPGRR